jgi:hypothetical protein
LNIRFFPFSTGDKEPFLYAATEKCGSLFNNWGMAMQKINK